MEISLPSCSWIKGQVISLPPLTTKRAGPIYGYTAVGIHVLAFLAAKCFSTFQIPMWATPGST